MLKWEFKPFSELSVTDLYEVIQLRSAVFIVEQACIYSDLDDKDQESFHLLGRLKSTEELVAYSRILPAGISFKEPSIGRVLTCPTHRKSGFGKELMQESIHEIKRLYPSQDVRIGAQTYLLSFYNSFGFKEVGKPYDEDGIEHIEMILTRN